MRHLHFATEQYFDRKFVPVLVNPPLNNYRYINAHA